MHGNDPYKLLGVSRTAGADEIKRAYRRLAKEHHPDRNPGDKSAETRFKEIQAAYEVLGDEDRRRQYDQFGSGGPRPDFANWSPHARQGRGVDFNFGGAGDLSSIFEQFFSGGRSRTRRTAQRQAPQPGANLETSVSLTLEEAARGAMREIELRPADGSGKPERIEFRIPSGVTDGQRIRVRGKGQVGAGGRGDLMIRCHIAPHPVFRRDGLNILIDLPLSIAEACLGTRVDLPTLDGPTMLTVPPGTSGGTKLRLRGKGLRDARTGETGDMHAVVRVNMPATLSPDARRLIEQLDAELKQEPRKNAGWRV